METINQALFGPAPKVDPYGIFQSRAEVRTWVFQAVKLSFDSHPAVDRRAAEALAIFINRHGSRYLEVNPGDVQVRAMVAFLHSNSEITGIVRGENQHLSH